MQPYFYEFGSYPAGNFYQYLNEIYVIQVASTLLADPTILNVTSWNHSPILDIIVAQSPWNAASMTLGDPPLRLKLSTLFNVENCDVSFTPPFTFTVTLEDGSSIPNFMTAVNEIVTVDPRSLFQIGTYILKVFAILPAYQSSITYYSITVAGNTSPPLFLTGLATVSLRQGETVRYQLPTIVDPDGDKV